MQEKFVGLTDEEVKRSRQEHGDNVITEKPPATLMEMIIESFKDPMIRLICFAAIIMIGMAIFGYADWFEPIGIIVAILLVTIISAKTQIASDKAYKKLKESTKHEAIKVIRNGELQVIDISEVVVGDIIVLQSGDKVPADGILIDGAVTVDNSALNGESEECPKRAGSLEAEMPDVTDSSAYNDAHAMFGGETVYSGEGLMVIRCVGMNTEMGKMAKDMEDEDVESPLRVKLMKLANQISTFGYVGAIIISIAYMLHFVVVSGSISNYIALGGINLLSDVIEAVTLAITIIVCAVPEGLPLMIAIVLMSNTGVMLKNNVLVRKPIGIETAGSMNILFSDKTGTITKNKLEVAEIAIGSGENIEVSKCPKIKEIFDIAICRNTQSMFDSKHNVVGGNTTDQVMLKYVGKETYDKLGGNSDYEITEQQEFKSSIKFSQAYLKNKGLTVYKGAPEKLLAVAKRYMGVDGSIHNLDTKKINGTIDKMAGKAMRVIAIGYSEKPMVKDEINDDLILVTVVGIRDEVRPEAIGAIKDVQMAGIQVVMITGDRKETAMAIAKDAGLLDNGDEALAFTSAELADMTDDEIKAVMSRIRVIARAIPTDKSRMVRLCQEMGLVTAMVGDGVNDSAALRRADVGFGMDSGTAVAKAASDIVLMDNSFTSIRNAVLYGRTIYKNILKFCKFQLSINVGAVLTSAILPFLGVEEALNVMQLLFVNLCMDTLASLALGQEPALHSYMLEPPKKRDENLVNKKMFIQFTSIGLFMTVLSVLFFKTDFVHQFFVSDTQLKTAFFIMFMSIAVFNGLNVRSEGFKIFGRIGENPNFIKVEGLMLLATLVIAMFGGRLFGCEMIPVSTMFAAVAVGITVIPFDCIRKLVFGTYKNS